MTRVLRSLDWRGFRAFSVSRVIELLRALLSDNKDPFPLWTRRCLAVPVGGDIDFLKHGYILGRCLFLTTETGEP